MRIIGLIICLTGWVTMHAQLYDAQWALGYDESVLDFRVTDTVTTYGITTFIYFTDANASICDETGTLLYYTNGINICGINGILSNGSGLSPCPYTNAYSSDGLNIPQCTLFVPEPGDSSNYYLFHFSNDAPDSSRPWRIYYSLIDKLGNNGLGAVVKKNVPFFQGQELRGGGMTACKHANGRDYWLIMGGSQDNEFFKFLITPDSIFGPYTQNIGCDFPWPYDLAYSKFSQDGTKFATSIISGAPILIMDFDRCTGEFSNPVTIFNKSYIDTNNTLSGAVSVEFSPNGEFLYASNPDNLVQCDLTGSDYQDSSQLFFNDTDYYGIHMLQLAPNGKIYASTWNGGLGALHVVSNPDLEGANAGFIYGGQPTVTLNSNNLPNLINYKLGPLVGSVCDTLNTGIMAQGISSSLRVLPNPADKFAYVEMGMQGNYEFDLVNSLGQLIAKRETRQVDNFDTEQLSSGIYFLNVIDKTSSNKMATQKVVVQH